MRRGPCAGCGEASVAGVSASLARVDQLSTGHRQRPEFSPHQSDAYSDSLRHRSRGRRQVASSSWAMAASLAPGITFAWKTPRPAPAGDTPLEPFTPASVCTCSVANTC